MKELINQLERITAFNIGDRAYINLPDGEPVIIVGYVVYSNNIEYQVRCESGIMQLEKESLVDKKILI